MLQTARLLLPEIREALRGRRFRELKEVLSRMWPYDVVKILEVLHPQEAAILLRLLPKDLAAHVFSELDPDLQERLLVSFTDQEVHEILEELDPDDRTELFEEMPANVVRRLLKTLTPEERHQVTTILQYPESSAGRLMSPEFVEAHANERVRDVIKKLIAKAQVFPEEVLHEVYVIDRERRLLGSVSLVRLLRAPWDTPVGELVEREPVAVSAWDDQEVAARLIQKYDLLALPVVDREGRLVGVITVDDVLDVLEEETAEDFLRFAAVADPEDRYFSLSVKERIRKRLPWLAGLALLANISSFVLHRYEWLLEQMVVLAVFIPILNGTAGNTGSQAASFVIRALATGELDPGSFRDLLRAWFRELVTAFLGLSLPLAGVVALTTWFRTGNVLFVLITASTMMTVVLLANSIGFFLPILARRLGLDPASISAPLNATLNDALTLLLYFSIAHTLLIRFGGYPGGVK